MDDNFLYDKHILFKVLATLPMRERQIESLGRNMVAEGNIFESIMLYSSEQHVFIYTSELR